MTFKPIPRLGAVVLGACMLTASVSASAQPVAYTRVLPGAAVTFSATQMGVPMHGRFKTVAVQVDFEPGDLAKSHLTVSVQAASVDAGSAQTNALLTGADWLAAKVDPQARFVSSGFTADGPGRYWLSGTLSIKGHSQPLKVLVTTHPAGSALAMDASFTINRSSFALGAGSWSDTSVVAAAIPVAVHLTVAPQ